jgi:predicted DsbA family dithiol-disulfide isomerase/type II secretory pathway component PulC
MRLIRVARRTRPETLAAALLAAATLACATPAARAAEAVAPPEGTFEITVEQARAASPVRVYQLEKALYDHLEIVARQLATSRGLGDDTPVALSDRRPPERPRLRLEAGDAPRTGAGADAVVEILVVENLAQIYSSRLDAALQGILRRHPDRVALVHKDFVLPRHPTSLDAAAAARCAAAQGRFWEYRGLLLADVDDQTPSVLAAHAGTLGLDGGAFASCFAGEDARGQAMAETEVVRGAGVVLPPTVLVDGIYVGGVEPAEALEDVVRGRLALLVGDEEPLPASRLDWELSGVLLVPGRRQAMLVREGSPTGRIVTTGDRLGANVTVVAIEPEGIVVDNEGRRERISLAGRRPKPPVPVRPELAMSDRALVRENVFTLPLSEDLRRRILAAREDMARQLTAAPLDVDGEKLLKLTGNGRAELWAGLGMEPNDVLVRANDNWIFAGKNGLFDALAAGGPATVVVMRRGIPYLLDLVPSAD